MAGSERNQEQALWQRYRAGDEAARDALLQHHLGLVHHVARQLIAGMPHAVELDDLVGMGLLGLVKAVEQFEPERGLAFSTYAVPRVRGAILDELRRLDWMPRSARSRARRLNLATRVLGDHLGRAPTPAEVATGLNLSAETYWSWRDDAETGTMVALDKRVGDADSSRLGDILPDPESLGFSVDVDDASDTTLLRGALDRLPARERTVLALYYFEELNLRQIGEIMGLTESRISQIRSSALRQLETALTPVLAA